MMQVKEQKPSCDLFCSEFLIINKLYVIIISTDTDRIR